MQMELQLNLLEFHYLIPKQKFIARVDQVFRPYGQHKVKGCNDFTKNGIRYYCINIRCRKKLGKLKQYKLQDSGDNTVLRTQFAQVPYNIQFGLYIMAKNTEDALQIVEQILPFFTPDFTVTMTTVEHF